MVAASSRAGISTDDRAAAGRRRTRPAQQPRVDHRVHRAGARQRAPAVTVQRGSPAAAASGTATVPIADAPQPAAAGRSRNTASANDDDAHVQT